MIRLVLLYVVPFGMVALAAAGANSQAQPPTQEPTSPGKVIRLYDGSAPGSENWTQQERDIPANGFMPHMISNVVDPTLTVFRPSEGKANGTAIVICPGGGMMALSIDSEGNDVARWLAARGVTGFVLKYRLVESKTDNPMGELFASSDPMKTVAPVVKLASADGEAAINYVRTHAEEYGIKPDRIGIIGFSAGGAVAISVGHTYTAATKPNFIAAIYPANDWALKGSGVPADAPPLFALAATDDPLGIMPQTIAVYQDWVKANKPAELHLYAKGGHGFGMRKQNLPSDRWIDCFGQWLDDQGLLSK